MDPERLIGQTLEHYHILRQIGYGGMATVFLAEDTKLERHVAVKVFWPRPGETRDFLRRFAREARVLAQLNHPNILPVYDYGELDKLANLDNLDNLAYLVTPYMAGGTLRDMLKARKVLPPVEALRLAAPILNALQYAHERGLIHRDIKPGNMLFKDDGSLLLADFGLVKVTGAGGPMEITDHTGTAITGTPEYMSPEQIEGRATQASDIYSVGIVLYEMLTGQRPFKADTAMGILVQQVHEQPRPMSEINPFLSPQLDSAVLRALEKDPAKRYTSPANFLQALMQAASPGLSTNLESTSQTLPAAWPPAQRPSQESPFMLPGNQPGVLPGTYGQNLPGALGANLSLAPAAQTRPGPITDPGQLPREGASTPVTPARELPVYPSPNRINVAPPQGPPGPSRPSAPHTPPPAQRPGRRLPLLPLLASAFSLLVIAGIVFGLTFTPFWPHLVGGGPGQTPTPGGHGKTPRPSGSVTVTASHTATPSIPCPAAGTARAPSMPPISLGSNANIVYFVNEGTPGAPTFGTLKRYDTVTGQRTEIVKMAKTRIDNAQLSHDGQWILFSAHVQGQAELGLARMDGHILQTLYCAPHGYAVTSPQWTEDQKLVAFDATPAAGVAKLYLLNMVTGSLSTELTPPASGLSYLPRTWLDSTHVLLTGYYPDSASPQQNIYILDTSKGANQQSSELQLLATVGTQQNPCWDFDSSIDGNIVYIDQCNPTQSGGTSTVQALAASGSASPTTAFSSSTLSINSVRVFEKQNKFLLATTTSGLYKITLDGSNNAIQLASASQGSVGLNMYSQYSWSNVSRDGSMYVLESYASGQNTTYSLFYGSINGGPTSTIASISDGTALEIIGWTTT